MPLILAAALAWALFWTFPKVAVALVGWEIGAFAASMRRELP